MTRPPPKPVCILPAPPEPPPERTWPYWLGGAVMVLAVGAVVLVGFYDAKTARADEATREVRVVAKENPVRVLHDDKRGVTCWLADYGSRWGAIACLPDTSLADAGGH